jgi:putative transposase
MTSWRAGCAERCTSGSEGGPRKRTSRKAGTAPRSDPYTYLRCWEGKAYFSFIIDVFSRKIVGWQFASHMRTDLVLDALRMALGTRDLGADFALVQHTDHGSQPGLNWSSQQCVGDWTVVECGDAAVGA